MPSLKDLKNRIGSVKSTRKITKAMQMVAAAKLRRAQEVAEAARPYAERMATVMSSLAAAVGDKAGAPYARLSFVCYFQELFVFQLRFVSWRGFGLRASDAPKKKAQQLKEEEEQAAKQTATLKAQVSKDAAQAAARDRKSVV